MQASIYGCECALTDAGLSDLGMLQRTEELLVLDLLRLKQGLELLRLHARVPPRLK